MRRHRSCSGARLSRGFHRGFAALADMATAAFGRQVRMRSGQPGQPFGHHAQRALGADGFLAEGVADEHGGLGAELRDRREGGTGVRGAREELPHDAQVGGRGHGEELRQALDQAEGTRPGAVMLDVVYAPWPTAVAGAWAQAGGALAPGWLMLLHQAVPQVQLMTGQQPDIDLMRTALLAAIAPTTDTSRTSH